MVQDVRSSSCARESVEDIDRDGKVVSYPFWQGHFFSIGWARTRGSWAWQERNPSGSWFPCYWQGSIEILVSGILMFSPISFFISSSSSSVFFLYRLSLIHRFIGKLPFLLSATLFCLSFNFPIFSAKQARGEIDVIPSILCLIGFPSFRGNFAVSLFFLDFFLLVRRILRVSRKYLLGIYFPI